MIHRNPVKTATFLIFCLGISLGITHYFKNREKVFPVISQELRVSEPPSENQIREILSSWVDLPKGKIQYAAEVFVDRNVIKYLIKTNGIEDFEKLVQHHHSPFLGWEIKVYGPIRLSLVVSYQNKLLSIDLGSVQDHLKKNPVKSPLDFLVGKRTDSYEKDVIVESISRRREVFEAFLPESDVLEQISVLTLDQKVIQITHQLILPKPYVDQQNRNVANQKTLFHLFEILNYLLLGLVFIVFFQCYGKLSVSFPKILFIFFMFLFFKFFENILLSEESNLFLRVVKPFIASLGKGFWLLPALIVGDHLGRQRNDLRFSLSNLISRVYFYSSQFRQSLVAGWCLACVQLLIVFWFYFFTKKLDWYVPLRIPGEFNEHQLVNFFRNWAGSFTTSLYEEALYRLFFIGVFLRYTRSVGLVILASAVLWGFLHVSYQYEPFFIRGLELSIVGIIYAAVFLRFGILATLTAHFLFNSFISSEYESHGLLLLAVNHLMLVALALISFLGRKKGSTFLWRKKHVAQSPQSPKSFIIRRNLKSPPEVKNLIKYAVFIMACMFALVGIHLYQLELNPMIDQKILVERSEAIADPYAQGDLWSLAYYRDSANKENNILSLDTFLKKDGRQGQVVWSVRVFSKEAEQVVCDFSFTQTYQLISMICNPLNKTPELTFEQWISRIKDPEEEWIFQSMEQTPDSGFIYVYKVQPKPKLETNREVLVTFRGNTLVGYEKKYLRTPHPPLDRENFKAVPMVVFGVFCVLGLFFFLKLFLFSLKNEGLYEQKALWAAAVSGLVSLLGSINGFRDIVLAFEGSIPISHFIFREVMTVGFKSLIIALCSYVLFFSLFSFAHQGFSWAPKNNEWGIILSRPIWNWRYSRTSLIYALILFSIQMFIRFLYEWYLGGSLLSVFRFNSNLLNHEYLIFTFFGALWRSLIFWVAIGVGLSVMFKYFPKWINVLIIIGIVLFSQLVFAPADLELRLLSILSAGVTLYFVFYISQFEPGFYVWLALLNSVTMFIPVVILPEFRGYFYQALTLLTFSGALILFTLMKPSPKN